jgi:poly(hydroxyalkanoate) depolymerase family esterase
LPDHLLDGRWRGKAHRPGVRERVPAGALDRLSNLGDFGPNPGALGARVYVPLGLRRGAALVVVLHGCAQTPGGYDHGAGWSALADAHGFALLFPEQRRANNANLCFNWFEPGDIVRGQGEAASIAAMIGAMLAQHAIDPRRVFVTGLSAGGAMANVMLATYPELFAGGAIIAGMPYGVATNVQQALGAMRLASRESAGGLAACVRLAAPERARWPRISVWHGDADQVVAVGNADAVVRQWAGVHGLGATPSHEEDVAGQAHREWRDADGRVIVEEWRLRGMGHGTPLGAEGAGVAGPFMLDVGLDSTCAIAVAWGIAPTVDPALAEERATANTDREAAPHPRVRRLTPEPVEQPAARGVAHVIEDALKKAGLMR